MVLVGCAPPPMSVVIVETAHSSAEVSVEPEAAAASSTNPPEFDPQEEVGSDPNDLPEVFSNHNVLPEVFFDPNDVPEDGSDPNDVPEVGSDPNDVPEVIYNRNKAVAFERRPHRQIRRHYDASTSSSSVHSALFVTAGLFIRIVVVTQSLHLMLTSVAFGEAGAAAIPVSTYTTGMDLAFALREFSRFFVKNIAQIFTNIQKFPAIMSCLQIYCIFLKI